MFHESLLSSKEENLLRRGNLPRSLFSGFFGLDWILQALPVDLVDEVIVL